MSLDPPTTAEGSLAEVATLLGLPDSSALAGLALDNLKQRTHRQLLEVSRRLGMSGVSKLNKEALASRLWQALLQHTQDARRPLVEEAGHQVLTHKFDVGHHGPAEEPRHIPWGYDTDRVTAAAVDPERLFVYWEVTDRAIEKARAQLGPSGADAWLNLRVYDTTGRIFDGTNAHSYFDHGVDRGTRQWFFHIGKPASDAFVEIGLISREGFFVKISRSSRVEFPRREPVGWQEPEWMTVRAGEAHLAGRGMPGGRAGAGADGAAGGGAPGGFDAVPLWQMRLPWEDVLRFGEGGREERVEWEEVWRDGGVEEHRRYSWESPAMVSSWEAGPYSYPVEVPGPVSESFEGPLHVYKVAGRTHVVYGPWQVVIRGLGAHFTRQVLGRWEVYRSWVAEEGHEVRGVRIASNDPGGALGSSEMMMMGASERRWRGESELRLAGGSERFYVGASERRLGGASEMARRGASEYRLRGASERRFLGATELRLKGASELMLKGATERLFRGGSEGRLGGGSEGRLGGASEQRLGGGEESPAPAEGTYPATPPSSSR